VRFVIAAFLAIVIALLAYNSKVSSPIVRCQAGGGEEIYSRVDLTEAQFLSNDPLVYVELTTIFEGLAEPSRTKKTFVYDDPQSLREKLCVRTGEALWFGRFRLGTDAEKDF